jgi:nicotinate-nucleotide adenylyltransferase
MEQIGQMSQSPCGGKRIAFFGGSFDPPHQGHLAVARAARAALGLDSVLFAPVGVQPLKSQGSTASFPDRLAMTSRAIAGEAGFAVSLIDAPKPSATPNYTLDTLLRLRSELPSDGRLFCLMGADSFFGLHLWHRAAEIPFVAPLIVASRPAASRPGQPLDDLRAALPQGLTMEPASGSDQTTFGLPASAVEVHTCLLRNLTGETSPFYLLPGLHVEISASEIRDGIRNEGAAISDSSVSRQQLLPAAVLEYIHSRGLYA